MFDTTDSSGSGIAGAGDAVGDLVDVVKDDQSISIARESNGISHAKHE